MAVSLWPALTSSAARMRSDAFASCPFRPLLVQDFDAIPLANLSFKVDVPSKNISQLRVTPDEYLPFARRQKANFLPMPQRSSARCRKAFRASGKKPL